MTKPNEAPAQPASPRRTRHQQEEPEYVFRRSAHDFWGYVRRPKKGNHGSPPTWFDLSVMEQCHGENDFSAAFKESLGRFHRGEISLFEFYTANQDELRAVDLSEVDPADVEALRSIGGIPSQS